MSTKIEDEDEKEAGLNLAENEHVSPCSMHPNSYLFKGIGLLFICSIGFGSYFCYDCPGALEVQILILNNSYYNIPNYLIFIHHNAINYIYRRNSSTRWTWKHLNLRYYTPCTLSQT